MTPTKGEVVRNPISVVHESGDRRHEAEDLVLGALRAAVEVLSIHQVT